MKSRPTPATPAQHLGREGRTVYARSGVREGRLFLDLQGNYGRPCAAVHERCALCYRCWI